MKTLLQFFVLILLSLNCTSQSLEGEWKGSFTYYFTDSRTPYYTYQTNNKPIRIEIILNSDSSYSGISYSTGSDSKGNDTIHVCAVLCKRLSTDSVLLQEIKLLKPNNVTGDCLQKMYLKFGKRKRSITLEGKWETYMSSCDRLSGEITLYQKTSN